MYIDLVTGEIIDKRRLKRYQKTVVRRNKPNYGATKFWHKLAAELFPLLIVAAVAIALLLQGGK